MISQYKKGIKDLPPRLVEANFFLIISVCTVVLMTSCNNSSIIGLNVQPNNIQLNVNFIDTTTLITKTVLTESIETDQLVTQNITSDALIGTYLDPVFGKTNASLYTQLRLYSFNPSFGNNPHIDAVILSLVYDSAYYGQTPFVPQNINVSRINATFNNATAYYSNDSLSVGPDLASNLSFIATPFDSLRISGTALSPQLRIPLELSFGQDILNQQGSPNLADSASFQNYLQGLYITTQNTTGLNTGEGNILSFKMADAGTGLTLYFHNDSSTASSSVSFSFFFNTVSRFSNFKHNYSISDPILASQLGNTPPAQNDVVFIQPMAGTRVKIEMPYLMNWLSDGKIAINQAELVVKINIASSYPLTPFSPPTNLTLYGINDDGSVYTLPDTYLNYNPTYSGGVFDPSVYEYSFNIARYIQQVLDGKLHNNGIYLTVYNEFINPQRIVVGGGGKNSLYQMKLKITRTKLP
jgi:hypothetical protein